MVRVCLCHFCFPCTLISGSGGNTLVKAFGVTDFLGWLIGTGVPLSIGASLLLCTKASRTQLLGKSSFDENHYSSLFLSFTIMSLLCMTVSTLIGFAVRGFNDYLTHDVFEYEFFQYIPQVLGSMMIVTLLFIPISMIIITAFDEKKLGLLAGTVLFLSLMIATGVPGFTVNRPEIVFLGPSNLVSALLL
ncbi:MAG: hypothetical protein P1Q69_14495, partial [Candidatus Thorarchaeota archaeon]|nr:hypothetical protein [Candidatus Thorarchaeota archaeon]